MDKFLRFFFVSEGIGFMRRLRIELASGVLIKIVESANEAILANRTE
jgi:hypothetical protein